jgi:uncharacterized cupredoxin-like copper-binding protein
MSTATFVSRVGVAALVVLSAAAMAGCGGGGAAGGAAASAQSQRTSEDDTAGAVSPPAPQNVVSITAREFSFAPSSIHLKLGVPVTLTIANSGGVAHDLKSDMAIGDLAYTKADNPADEQKDNVAHSVLDVDFDPGSTAVVTFTPRMAGSFVFHCDVPGHTEAGMTGTFVVSP